MTALFENSVLTFQRLIASGATLIQLVPWILDSACKSFDPGDVLAGVDLNIQEN